MVKESVTKALLDSGLQIQDIKQACVGYVYGMQIVLDCPKSQHRIVMTAYLVGIPLDFFVLAFLLDTKLGSLLFNVGH